MKVDKLAPKNKIDEKRRKKRKQNQTQHGPVEVKVSLNVFKISNNFNIRK